MVIKKVIKDPFYQMLIGYVFLSILFGLIYQNGLILFLGWNLILVGIAYSFANLFVCLRKIKKYSFFTLMIIILFILFFPNTIYVLTDFIHLENYDFFTSYPSGYAYGIEDWIVFMMITIGALLAAKIGVLSLFVIKPYLYPFIQKFHIYFLFLLFLASSFGIYLGRFFRLNSWDILKIFDFIPMIFDEFTFFLSFMGISLLIHSAVYIIMSNSGVEKIA